MTTLDVAAPRELREAIESAATIMIGSEPLPDGDAFGAELSLVAMIRSAYGLAGAPSAARAGKGPKYVAVLNELGVPERYAFLEDAALARAPQGDDKARAFDLAICVDGGVERMGQDVAAIFGRARARVYVDHHSQGSRARYDLALVDSARASTTELLAQVLDDPAWRDVPLSRPLAEAIYVGLISDTGGFLYSLTTPRTHELAARLLEAGVRATMIGERVILELTFEDVTLKAKVLERMRLVSRGRVLAAELLLSMLDGKDPRLAGYDKIVMSLAFVRGVEVTMLLREFAPESWKLSLRSRGHVDVASVARDLDPDGGGHVRAAGCSLKGELEDVRARVIAAIGRRGLDGPPAKAGGG